MELYIGIGLIILGILIIFIDRSRSKTSTVNASTGSVSVGGKNTGSITNVNVGRALSPPAHNSHTLTYVAIVVEIIGIAITLWHAWHMAST